MPLINIKELNKFYPHVVTNKQRVRGMLKILMGRDDAEGAHVLKDVSLTVNAGESMAIIGKNGAGKSTLLKILSEVIQPTSGHFAVNGSVGALLELGSGFDPEYTGLENLNMAAAMAGLGDKDLTEKIERMIAFADIGEYIHEPVKHYSSGMVVRLGFAVITETCPDLLITDEVLAVGDESFQLKCLQWIDQYLAQGGTLLLVSHSVYHVQKLCQKAVWLEHGEVKMTGDVFEVTQAYQASIADSNEMPSGEAVNRSTYHIADAQILQAGEVTDVAAAGSDIELVVKVFTPDEFKPGICIGVVKDGGTPVYGTYSELHDCDPVLNDQGEVEYRVKMPNLSLLPGRYEFRFHTMTPENIQMIDTFERNLRVTGKSRELGVSRLNMEWQ